MNSILQKDATKCFLCGGIPNAVDPLDRHHVFGGACRTNSERCGLIVYIHHNKCHIFGENAVHANARVDLALKRYAQKKAMKHYKWKTDDFIRRFRKNYLEGDNNDGQEKS